MNPSVLLPAFISFEEITVILLIAVVVFGPKKIPEIARGLGEGMRAMKKATEDIKREILDSADGMENPVKDIKDTIEDTANSVSDSVSNPVKDFKESLDDAVGPIKRE
ncbi:MAG: twin-arginine translocase TatA/TatE family subunit [Flavobacteriia bacterium]|nr:twin-arginine translocase TatA/TatE family subunit [Flavobacteriia bacterium]